MMTSRWKRIFFSLACVPFSSVLLLAHEPPDVPTARQVQHLISKIAPGDPLLSGDINQYIQQSLLDANFTVASDRATTSKGMLTYLRAELEHLTIGGKAVSLNTRDPKLAHYIDAALLELTKIENETFRAQKIAMNISKLESEIEKETDAAIKTTKQAEKQVAIEKLKSALGAVHERKGVTNEIFKNLNESLSKVKNKYGPAMDKILKDLNASSRLEAISKEIKWTYLGIGDVLKTEAALPFSSKIALAASKQNRTILNLASALSKSPAALAKLSKGVPVLGRTAAVITMGVQLSHAKTAGQATYIIADNGLSAVPVVGDVKGVLEVVGPAMAGLLRDASKANVQSALCNMSDVSPRSFLGKVRTQSGSGCSKGAR